MDKLDYAILDVLLNTFGAVTRMKSVTLKVILTEIQINDRTLYRRLKNLLIRNYILKGIQDIREHTYYISEHGMKILEEALK